MGPWEQIFYNIVGSALIAILTWLFLKLVKKYYKWDFKRIFGKDSAENFFIVYGRLKHRLCFEEDGKPMEWLYYKPEREGAYFKAFSVTSLAETKSAKYPSLDFWKEKDVSGNRHSIIILISLILAIMILE